jgi:alpha-galactosidase
MRRRASTPRAHVLGGRLRSRPRPVHLNTWEAVYFDHDVGALKSLADAAAAVGVERFVLDDGWFRGRADDRAGLGDWTADPAKYPQGLTPLIDHVRGLGMAFGLWVEPEMVNRDSDLARAHPDWILGVDGRDQPLGRGQYVLDLANPAAFEAIADTLDALLASHEIAYLKWDMNRDLTHARSRGRPAVHAQTLAVYALIDRLRSAHPQVEIESCASGGGRIDFAILARTDRVWASDCLDPFDRQAIQRSLSIFLPPELIGSHVGAARSHTTGRSASLALRALTALFGAMGVEADVRAMGGSEREGLTRWIALYKRWRPLIHGGALRRLDHPDPGCFCIMVGDGDDALVSIAQVESPISALPAPLRLPDMGPAAWTVQRLGDTAGWRRRMKRAPATALGEPVTLTGGLLARPGLPLPVLQAGDCALFHLRRD